jgi:hypothetical protein
VEAYPRTLDTQLTSIPPEIPHPLIKAITREQGISANQALLTAQNQKPSSAIFISKSSNINIKILLIEEHPTCKKSLNIIVYNT